MRDIELYCGYIDKMTAEIEAMREEWLAKERLAIR